MDLAESRAMELKAVTLCLETRGSISTCCLGGEYIERTPCLLALGRSSYYTCILCGLEQEGPYPK